MKGLSLRAISPVDGRYADKVSSLRDIFTGREWDAGSGRLAVAQLLAPLPAAVLVGESAMG